MILRILGKPTRQIYRDARDFDALAAGEARHELLLSVGTLRSSVDGETPNITAVLRNDSAQCARLFARPPIGATAELRNQGGIVFSGTIRSVALGKDCELGIEA